MVVAAADAVDAAFEVAAVRHRRSVARCGETVAVDVVLQVDLPGDRAGQGR
ncbi:hypothetical protein ILP97_27325 [Amycolatopsis sp. H6(2020)]|nr:hypothetical protein [Amycolatopsis sp. H6(2020)]